MAEQRQSLVNYFQALNRLCKWRTLLTSWQLGTRSADDPECQAVKDHREVSLILRSEVSALVGLLIAKGVFTAEEFEQQGITEAQELEKTLEARFPGAKATDAGMTLDTVASRHWLTRFPK